MRMSTAMVNKAKFICINSVSCHCRGSGMLQTNLVEMDLGAAEPCLFKLVDELLSKERQILKSHPVGQGVRC